MNISTTENRKLMAQARESLKGNWGVAVGANLISTMLSSVVSFIFYFICGCILGVIIIVPLYYILLMFEVDQTVIDAVTEFVARVIPFPTLTGPFIFGLIGFYLSLSRGQEFKLEQIFNGFKKGKFVKSFLAGFYVWLFVFLWSLLCIIPGIIKAYSYLLTFWIMADDDSISPLEAITKSREMMDGNKFKSFCLGWRFFGWGLLSLLTCFIGSLWLGPYINVSYTKFYEDIKNSKSKAIKRTTSKKVYW